MTSIAPGTCRHCGCHCSDDDHCTTETGDPCVWADGTRTWCGNRPCRIAEAARLENLKLRNRQIQRTRESERLAKLHRKRKGRAA